MKISSKGEFTKVELWEGSLWALPIQQEEQNSMKFLFKWEMLQWLRTIFMRWSFGWPNLACQRLATFVEETTTFEHILELLLTFAVEQER